MNNKGYLLVEIIVASVIAMSMMYFLLEITIKLKNINEDYYVETKLETDQILMLKDVMNDLSSYELKKVYVNNNIVDFTFNNGTNDFIKRITIDDKMFKYGTISDGDYVNNDIYVKSFDKTLNVENIKIENLCYQDQKNKYEDCNELGTSSVSKGLLKINIPAKTIYSDTDYGINLNIPYNTKDISIYIPIEPVISSKGDNFTIDEGDNYNVIEEYFTYDTNGGKDIINKKCLVNNTAEIIETSDLSAGTYNISCAVTNDDDLTASASTTLTVNEKVKFTYISAKSSGNAYTTSVEYKNNAFIREFNNSGTATAIGCSKDTCYISAKDSGNAYTTTAVYKNGSFVKEFNNNGVTSAIGCTIDTCYISAQSSGNAYSTTVVYKDGSFVKQFNNSGVTKAIGCTTDTCYISAQSSRNAYTTPAVYKDESFVKEFNNSGVTSAIGCTIDTCYISAQSSSNAYSTTVVYKYESFVREFNNSGVTKAIGCTTDTCYISAQSSSNAYTTTVVYKNGSFVKEFNNSGVTSAIGCTTDTCYISAQSSRNAYSTTVMYKDGSFVREFNNSGVVIASGGNNH